MKCIDVRFDSDMIHMLEKMVGKVFEKYKCDLFLYSGRSYGLVGLYVDGTVSKLLNTLETQDYYGDVEDVAMFTIQPAVDSDIKSPFIDGKMVEIPIMTAIQRIQLIEEHQKLFYNGDQVYDVWLTRGVIFELEDGREISFEKSVWFSEIIETNRGYHLLEKFSPVEEFIENWDQTEGYRGECERMIRILS